MDEDTLPLESLGEPRKRCSMCKQWKPLDGRQNACKPCNIARNQRWYREHPEARAARLDEYARRRKRDLQERLLGYLRAHPSVDCGESDPIVLDFDHLRDKIANVSHRRRTAARARTYRYLDSIGEW